jgi:hypothetical protein
LVSSLPRGLPALKCDVARVMVCQERVLLLARGDDPALAHDAVLGGALEQRNRRLTQAHTP